MQDGIDILRKENKKLQKENENLKTDNKLLSIENFEIKSRLNMINDKRKIK
ncbi:MAG: hypothetical protein GWP19_03900 [Planctomycetia bacterium]|nr:hypothetical protein [Planctomycetia bacterium]